MFKLRYLVICLAFLLQCFTVSLTPAFGKSIPEIVGNSAAGDFLKGVLDGAKQQLADLLNDANLKVDARINQLINQLQTLIADIDNRLGERINQVNVILKEEERVLLNTLIRTTNEFEGNIDNIIGHLNKTVDKILIDMHCFAPFIPEFDTRSITGLVQAPYSCETTRIKITGGGYGTQTETRQTDITNITFEQGNRVTTVPFREDKNAIYVSEVVINNEWLKGYCNENHPTALALKLSVRYGKKGTFYGWNYKTYEVPIRILLLPKYAPELVGSYSPIVVRTDVIGGRRKWGRDMLFGPNDHRIPNSPIEQGLEIAANVSLEGVACGGYPDPHYEGLKWRYVDGNHRQIEVHYVLFAGPPADINVEYTVQKKTPLDNTLRVRSEFGKCFSIRVPGECKTWSVKGEWIDNREITISGSGHGLPDIIPSNTGIKFHTFTNEGDLTRFDFEIPTDFGG